MKYEERIVPKSRKIIFQNYLSPGDILMFSALLRDIKLMFPELEIGYTTCYPELIHPNPYIVKLDPEDSTVSIINIHNRMINKSYRHQHMSEDFFMSALYLLAGYGIIDTSISNLYNKLQDRKLAEQGFLNCRPCITLTEKDKTTMWLRSTYDVDRYWVIAPGGKTDAITKIWNWKEFQKVIDHFKGFIKFVAIGRSDHILEENLEDCIYLTNQTNVRDIFHLVYHSDGVISGISYLMHVAAGIKNYANVWTPCVKLHSGRETLAYTYFENHQILHSIGSVKCDYGKNGAGCWKSKVTKEQLIEAGQGRLCECKVDIKDDEKIVGAVPKCLDIIKAEDIIRAIEIYYKGDIYGNAWNEYMNKDYNKFFYIEDNLKYEIEYSVFQEFNNENAFIMKKDKNNGLIKLFDNIDGKYRKGKFEFHNEIKEFEYKIINQNDVINQSVISSLVLFLKKC